MSDDQPRSGSRWEPPPETSPLPADPPAGSQDAPPESPADRRASLPWWKRRPSGVRPAIAAGIAAVALVGVGGGYAVGRVVDDDPARPAGFTDGGVGHRDGGAPFDENPGGGLPPGDAGRGGFPGGPDLDDDGSFDDSDDGDSDDGDSDDGDSDDADHDADEGKASAT